MPNSPIAPTIEYPDFQKLDIRVGHVKSASSPEWSNKLLEFKVDFGPEIGERTILSGVKKWYSPDDFIGNFYLFVVNLAERKMGKGVSQGMMLMADQADSDDPDNDKPVPLSIIANVEAGVVVR